MGFPCGSAGKEPTCNAGDLGSTRGLGRSPGEVKGYLLHYSGLENSMDCIVHGVTKSWTQLSNFHLLTCLSAYLMLLIFLLEILIPACTAYNPEFLMMYSAYKLNKQGDNTQPWCTPFPIWNQSIFSCLVLTVASWHAYRFLRRHV